MAPHPDPHRSGQWRFDDPPHLSSDFLDDFVTLLKEFRRGRMKLLPSLIDFQFCYPGEVTDGRGNLLPSGFVKCGRGDVVFDPSKRQKFFDRALEPLLARSARFRDVIDTWEVINEPEWVTQGSGVQGPRQNLPLAKMLAFIREAAFRINRQHFRSTVGYAKYESILQWEQQSRKLLGKSLDVTLHQFHYYPVKERYWWFLTTRPRIPLHVFDPRWPCLIGEFATAPHEPWPEIPTQDVYGRLKLIERKKYPSAYLWSARAANPPPPKLAVSDWSPAVQHLVDRYTSGR
jgi:hypothetical protein